MVDANMDAEQMVQASQVVSAESEQALTWKSPAAQVAQRWHTVFVVALHSCAMNSSPSQTVHGEHERSDVEDGARLWYSADEHTSNPWQIRSDVAVGAKSS
jgi:hypothetical protein